MWLYRFFFSSLKALLFVVNWQQLWMKAGRGDDSRTQTQFHIILPFSCKLCKLWKWQKEAYFCLSHAVHKITWKISNTRPKKRKTKKKALYVILHNSWNILPINIYKKKKNLNKWSTHFQIVIDPIPKFNSQRRNTSIFTIGSHLT